MKVAVIGCGHWGKNLVRNFSELGALVPSVIPMQLWLLNLLQTIMCQRSTLMPFWAGDCDGVVIAAPAPLHASLAQKAFAAGKHVYVEKPLAMTLDEADAMIDAAAQANRQLMVGHLLQYHPVFARLRDMVKLAN